MKTVKGIQYAVTANEEVVITDDNGLNLTCPAGEQTYFVATGDEVEVVGDGVVTQTRGGIIAGGGGGGGGGEKIAPGEVVLGTKSGSQVIEDVTTMTNGKYQLYGKRYLEEWDLDLPALENGYGMFSYCIGLTSFNGTLPALTNGQYMFNGCVNLSSITGELPALKDGSYLFYGCSNLSSITVGLPSLTKGNQMFSGCLNLKQPPTDFPALTSGEGLYRNSGIESFNADFPLNTAGDYMFYVCRNLKYVNSEMAKLRTSTFMFQGCESLESFAGDLSSLYQNVDQMFSGCTSLTTFTANLKTLYRGFSMFTGCTSLTSFASDLPSLNNASGMFRSCKLDLASVNRIATTIKSFSSGSHPITIGVDSTQVTQEQQDAANTIMVGKGWTVYWERN